MTGPVRILSVGNMYPPHHQGGYELVWQSANRWARAQGHVVRVVTSTHRDLTVADADEPDVHRTLRWYWDWDRYAFERLPIAARIRIERTNAAQLRRHLRAFRPDVVAWWSMGHMSLGLIEQVRRAGIPAILSIHNDWLVYGPKADQWTGLWLDRSPVLAAAADRALGLPTVFRPAAAGRLVFNSRYSLRAAAAAGIASPDSEIIHPGIAREFTDPAPAAPWRWRLLYAGRIDRGKGVDTAVAALEQLPEARLAIHGKGDAAYTDELRSLARDLGAADRVAFGEFADPGGLRRAYAEADAVLFPVRWQEPWGLVPLEAMGMGRPVVATAGGGTTEFIAHEHNALVVAPDDPAGLAAAVGRLAADPGLRASLVRGGLDTARRHTAAEFDRRTVEAIVGAAGLPRGRAGQTAIA
ncbi:MAG TPA: glycosyltransferase [Solirubrobacteraceae bacterium]|nr:glycosyltransferase [Solirubrobacteraceae bacterium]